MPTNKKKEKALEATPITDFHGRRRELLKIGVEQGYLDWKQLDDAFNKEFISDTELEVLLFTCEQMGIEIKNRPTA